MSKGRPEFSDQIGVELGKTQIKAFLKACREDLNPERRNKPVNVYIHTQARETAKTDFNLNHEIEIKEFVVSIEARHLALEKFGALDHDVFGFPKGSPLEVYFFSFKSVKDGYLSFVHWKARKLWLLKSLKKNEKETFDNSLQAAFAKAKIQ